MPHFHTYIHGLRAGHATSTPETTKEKLLRLFRSPKVGPQELVGAEVRITDKYGAERLYAVVAQHGENLVLKTIDGGDSILASTNVVHH